MNTSEPAHRGNDEAARQAATAGGADEDSVDEATVVADRNRQTDDQTVLVDRADNDSTVVVERDDNDHTIVVERGGDQTVVVERGDGDRTVVVERGAPDADATVVVGKRVKAKTPSARAPRGRQRINLPPVDPGFAEKAVIAAGPGAIESYAARELPAQPLPVPRSEQQVAVVRPSADAVPSVRKSSRRFGVIAVAGFVVACVISVAGLIAIAFAVLRSL